MNRHFKFLSFLITLSLLALPQSALACKVLAKVQADDTVDVSAEEIQKCIERGEDAPFHLRAAAGLKIKNTAKATGNLQAGFCNVDGTCPNAARERTVDFVAGAGSQNNPSLNLPEIPWKDMDKVQIPCGAVGGLAEIALQSLWGNVRINLPSSATSLINTALNNLLGGMFKKIDCSDGTFWGTLNNMLNVILPTLGIGGNSGNNGFVFNVQNSTFIAPSGTLLVMPKKATFAIDLSMGGANFNLPAGGHFIDTSGSTVNLAPGSTVQFHSNGDVTTNSGKSFKVTPAGVVTLDPHGAVTIPAGSVVPVPANTTLFPMGPKSKPPAWAKST